MTTAIKPAPVRKSVTVEAPLEKTFEVFTRRFGQWWPALYSIGTSPLKDVRIEGHPGGRWYEIGEDGSEADWGEVLVWEAPSHLLLAWRIRADWRYDPALLTEIEIRFVPLGEKATRVDLEHRRLENMGDSAETARRSYDSEQGWSGILGSFAAEARRP